MSSTYSTFFYSSKHILFSRYFVFDLIRYTLCSLLFVPNICCLYDSFLFRALISSVYLITCYNTYSNIPYFCFVFLRNCFFCHLFVLFPSFFTHLPLQFCRSWYSCLISFSYIFFLLGFHIIIYFPFDSISFLGLLILMPIFTIKWSKLTSAPVRDFTFFIILLYLKSTITWSNWLVYSPPGGVHFSL